MVRFLVSILLGVAVTFALFAFMAFLISGGDGRNAPPPPAAAIEIVTSPPDTDLDTRRRTPPPPPPPPEQPPETPENEPDTSDDASLGLDMGFDVDIGDTGSGLTGPGEGMGRDGDAQPIVRINPRFPPAAARDGISGWVRLRFTIDETGGVTDVEVIDAEPRRVFDQEARRALLRWKYKPKVVDGKAVRQEGQTVQLDFNLDEE